MPKMVKCLAGMVAVCLMVWMPVKSSAQTTNAPCVLGYTVGFFNGVWNTELDAMDGMNGIQGAVREVTGNSNDTYNNEDVGYVVLYNHTGSTVGSGKWQDVAETWEQRANELDATGMLAQDVLMLDWEFLNGASAGTLNLMTGQSTTFSATANQFLSDFTLSATQAFGYITAAPPTQADYAAQDNQLTTLAAAGRKLLLVAHSQGNLFMNPAYDFIQPVVGSTRVKAVQIAPASPTLRGQYILSYNDLVINALRAQGGTSTVQPNNIGIPLSTNDLSGHTLVATYLDPSRNGRPVTEQLLVGALSALTAPSGCAVSVTPQQSSSGRKRAADGQPEPGTQRPGAVDGVSVEHFGRCRWQVRRRGHDAEYDLGDSDLQPAAVGGAGVHRHHKREGAGGQDGRRLCRCGDAGNRDGDGVDSASDK
jgi:hypothetical protein